MIWRLLRSGPLDGPLNMAIDEAILNQRQRQTVPSTLRFYSWQKKYCSFGYFQEPDPELISFCRRQRFPLVRRPTGGGFVLHDREITFSLVFSREEVRKQRTAIEYYRVTTACFQQALQKLGLPVRMEEKIVSTQDKASFCFSQPTKYDLLLDGRKICGSAQRRYQNIILQQGSLILSCPDRSRFWESAAGLTEFLPATTGWLEICRAIEDSLSAGLGISFREGRLTAAEEEEAEQLSREKYARIDWNQKTLS